MGAFPFAGSGALNRLCVHPSLVDFAERALDTDDIRLYQAHAAAKYAGLTNYEQPMHTDRNHSWLPAVGHAPWWNLTGFLYLNDVTESENPTLVVSVRDSAGVDSPYPVILPEDEPGHLRGGAAGTRGARLVPRLPLRRLAPRRGLRGAETARFTLGLCFRRADHEWIGYDTQQSRSTGEPWTAVRRGLDRPRTRPVRLSRAGPPHLDRRALGRDGEALPRARPRPLEGGAGRIRPVRRAAPGVRAARRTLLVGPEDR